jgi:3'(2'), 5'-bisphosphate nucleotidase
MPDYAKYADAARRAVSMACTVCRDVQSQLDDVRAITKDDRSPVTVADFASQAVVAHILTEALGEVILVAEETSGFLRDEEHAPHLQATIAAARSVWPEADERSLLEAIDVGAGDTHHRGFWTLDPIDGTKGFLRGQQYAIALAYIEAGSPVVGVMGCPNLPRDFAAPLDRADPHGSLYCTIRGDGVFELPANDIDAEAVNIRRLDHEEGEPISICSSVEKAHSSESDMDRILAHIGEASEPVRLDSQCKYAVVGRGQADAYLRLPTRKDYVERIWDHGAGSLVATEAGAAVSDIHGNALDFSHGRGLEKNKGIVCAPARVHGLMLEAIRALGIGG